MMAAQSPSRLRNRAWQCKISFMMFVSIQAKSSERSNIPHSCSCEPPGLWSSSQRSERCLVLAAAGNFPSTFCFLSSVPPGLLLQEMCGTFLPLPHPGKVTFYCHLECRSLSGVPGVASLPQSCRAGLRSRSFHRKKTLREEKLSQQHCRGSGTALGPFTVSIIQGQKYCKETEVCSHCCDFFWTAAVPAQVGSCFLQGKATSVPHSSEAAALPDWGSALSCDFPGYFPGTEQAPPSPVNFWVLTSLPQPLPEVAVDVKQSPEQHRFYCHRNAGASDESSLQGVGIAFAPLPDHLQEKTDTESSPPAAKKP